MALIGISFLLSAPGAGAANAPGNSLFIAGTVNYLSVPHATAFDSLPFTAEEQFDDTPPLGNNTSRFYQLRLES